MDIFKQKEIYSDTRGKFYKHMSPFHSMELSVWNMNLDCVAFMRITDMDVLEKQLVAC